MVRDLEYWRARTHATVLWLEDCWRSLVERRRVCRARYRNTQRRCQKPRGHGGPHVSGSRSWGTEPVTDGHVHVDAPEAVYCPCGGVCHRGQVPCSFSCIVHRVRETRR